jgi:outer membrane biosynthesis protein TonB
MGRKVTQPILKEKKLPDLEKYARKQVRGTVIVAETVIKEDGTVGDIRLLRGVDPEMDQAFMDSLEEYIFEPATLDGKPVPVRYILTLRIHIQ